LQKKIEVVFVLMLSILLLSGCTTEFEDNIFGTWITKNKISLPNSPYEAEYEYLVFLQNGKYQTNIFGHLFVEGNFFLKEIDGDYFFQLEYKDKTTSFQYTYEDDSYSVLKIKNDKDIVTVFHREENV